MAFNPDTYLKEQKTVFDPDAYISEVEAEEGGEQSYIKQVWGSWMKGGMKLGQAVLEAPIHTAKLISKLERPSSPEYVATMKDAGGLGAAGWESAEAHKEMIKSHKRGQKKILENHPEWEYDPPENFLDLLTSPRKLSLAVAESTPLLVGAGVMSAGGRPDLGVAMMYASEGQDAYDQAIDYGATKEQAETAYHVYGSVASVLEYLQLRGIVKIGKGAFKRILNRTVQKTAGKTLKREIIETGAKEAIQESTQGAWGEATAKIVYDRPVEGGLAGFIDRRAQEGLIGATMGIVPGLGGSVAGVVSSKAARSEKIQAVEALKSQIEESDVSDTGKNKLYEEFEQMIQDISEGKFDVAEEVAQVQVEAQALPSAQQDAAETISRSNAEYVARSEELRGLEYDQLVELVNQGDELAAQRIQEMDAEEAVEQGLPTFEVLFEQMLEGDQVAQTALADGAYKGGRARMQGLEAEGRVDPTVPATDDQVRNIAIVRVHNAADLLGVDKTDRYRIQKDITGKESMKDMDMKEAKRVEAYFIAEAKKRGVVTSMGKELADFIKVNTTPKGVQDKSGTKFPEWKRMLHGPGKIISKFVNQMKRVERLLEALDGFTEGPVYNSIWTSVHTQTVNSRAKYGDRVGKFKEALIDIMTPELNTEAGIEQATEFIQEEEKAAGKKARKLVKRAVRKLVGDSFIARWTTGGAEVALEATDTNPELSLTASERMGIYVSLKNEESRNHLFSADGRLGVFTNPAAAALEVVQNMPTQEKQIADWVLADLEANFQRANQAAVLGLGRTLEQQVPYPLKLRPRAS